MTLLPIDPSAFRPNPSSCRSVDRAREEQAYYDAYAEAGAWHALVVPGVTLMLAVLAVAVEVTLLITRA